MPSLDEHSAASAPDPGRVYFRAHIVVEMYWATTTSTDIASNGKSMHKLFNIVWSAHLPGVQQTHLGLQLLRSTFFLQETNADNAVRRSRQFEEVRWNKTLQYKGWYRRNVQHGSGKTLLVEIHMRTIPKMLSFDVSREELLDRQYYLLERGQQDGGVSTWGGFNEFELEDYEGGPEGEAGLMAATVRLQGSTFRSVQTTSQYQA